VCASGNVAHRLTQVKAARREDGAFSVVSGICGKPYRRYMNDLEPLIMPLFTFKHGLGLDRVLDMDGRAVAIDC
jgi:hypothetical protein